MQYVQKIKPEESFKSWYSIVRSNILSRSYINCKLHTYRVVFVVLHWLEYFSLTIDVWTFDLPTTMTSKISLLLVVLPKISFRLVERSVIRVGDKFDRRWQSRFLEEKNWHFLRFFPSSRLNAMKHVLVSRDRLFSTDTSNPVLLSWNIPSDIFCKIFPEFF